MCEGECMNFKFREPVNGITHLIGAILSVVGMLILIIHSEYSDSNSVNKMLSAVIFGSSLIMLYSASSIYHSLNVKERVISILKKLDHSMIFILIAGTYTPICLITLNGVLGYVSLAIVWIMAISGVFLKIFWIECPRGLSTGIYIFMGWMCLVFIYPLWQAVKFQGILFLFLGGVMYTIGGVIYGLKKPNCFKALGFHEIFHLFVMAGSLFHFLFMVNFVF